MTKEDKEFLAELIKNQPSKEDKYNVVDLAFKALSFIMTALVFWIFTVVNDTQHQVNEMSVDAKYFQAQVGKLEEFSKYPRFTQENFVQGILPLKTAIEANTIILNQRRDFMNSTESDLSKLKERVSKVEYYIENNPRR